jgi:hypothetical protein
MIPCSPTRAMPTKIETSAHRQNTPVRATGRWSGVRTCGRARARARSHGVSAQPRAASTSAAHLKKCQVRARVNYTRNAFCDAHLLPAA